MIIYPALQLYDAEPNRCCSRSYILVADMIWVIGHKVLWTISGLYHSKLFRQIDR